MNNDEVLGHLLQIENEAAALVDGAQVEADRRIAEAEKQARADCDERCRKRTEQLEAELRQAKEQAQGQYMQELESFHDKMESLGADTGRFSALLEELVAKDA